MIQVRNNIFETNSSSSHSLTVMPRTLYNDWRSGKVALSIRYIFNGEEVDKYKFNRAPAVNLPENFNDKNKAIAIKKEKNNSWYDAYDYENLRDGDNGFMRNWGNFDTYAPVVMSANAEDQVKENLKMLETYIDTSKWYIDYLKENNKYDAFMTLIEEYKNTGKFTEEMYDQFPDYLFYTADEYYEMLGHNECHSPFIHVFADVVAFGHYFHS